MTDLAGPMLTRRKVVLVGLEATRGTAVTPTLPLFTEDPKVELASPFNARKPVGPSGGNVQGTHGRQLAKITLKFEYRGSGTTTTADPAVAAILQMCGVQLVAGVFSPVTAPASQKCGTIQIYEDGNLKSACGCAGNLKFEFVGGERCMITADLQGVWIPPIAGALPTVTLNQTLPPRFTAMTLTPASGGSAMTPYVDKLTFDLGNKVTQREQPCVAGVIHFAVTDRDPRLTFEPESSLISTYDAFAAWEAAVLAAVSLTLSGGANDSATFAFPTCQYEEIGEGDRNGKQVDQVKALCLVGGGGVDNEWSVTPS